MNKIPKPIPTEYFRQRLEYFPDTGLFIWKAKPGNHWTVRRWNTRYAGQIATRDHSRGYLRIGVDSVDYLAHRVAWALMNGDTPEQIDHKNRDRGDNRIDNLRLATQSQNNANQESRTSLPKGVSVKKDCPNRPYYAQLKVNGKHVLAKCFSTVEEASAAYTTAAKRHFGDFTVD